MNNKSRKDQQNQSNGKGKMNRELESKKLDKLCNDVQFWKVIDEVQPTPVEALEKIILKYPDLLDTKSEILVDDYKILKFWNITLLYGSYSEEADKVYALKLKSKTGEHSEVYVLNSDLIDNRKMLYKKMKARGIASELSIIELEAIADKLIVADAYTEVNNIELFFNREVCLGRKAVHNILEKYRITCDDFIDNDTVYPERLIGKNTTVEAYQFDKNCHGVKLNSQADIEKFGNKAYAVLPSVLLTLWGIDNTQTRGVIIKELIKMGVVYDVGENRPRKDLTITVRPGLTKRCYIFNLDKNVYEGGAKYEV